MPDELSPIPRAPLDRGTSDTLYNTFVDSFEATREKFSRFFQTYPADRGPAIPEVFLATIQSKGPNNEADFTDARYYLKRQQVDTSLDYDKTGTGKDVLKVEAEDVLGPQLGPNLIATNMAELPKSPGSGFRHSLTSDTPVLVVAIRSKANPVFKYYVFSQQPPGGMFDVTVSQDGGGAGTNSPAAAASYTYTVTDLNGNQLGTTIPVAWARQKGHVTAANNGMACYDQTGALKLAIVDEVIDVGAC